VPNYTYHSTSVLKNKLGLIDGDQLDKVEGRLVRVRCSEIDEGNGPKGNFDVAHLKAIHHYLFQDIYEWAGHTRDEPFSLTDGTVASEPVMRKGESRNFLAGSAIPDALEQIAARLRGEDYLRGLDRNAFATQAAAIMATLNSVHPFREGNGRTQRIFMSELAVHAGHSLDFSVISQERMIRASIAAHEHDDTGVMRRLFNDASDPARFAALSEAIAFLEKERFPWNDRYIATAEPGHEVKAMLAGVSRDNVMVRTETDILIGHTSDLPMPHPRHGEWFMLKPESKASSDQGKKHTAEQSATPESEREAPSEERSARFKRMMEEADQRIAKENKGDHELKNGGRRR